MQVYTDPFLWESGFSNCAKLEYVDENRLQIWAQRQKSIKNNLKNLMQHDMTKNSSPVFCYH